MKFQIGKWVVFLLLVSLLLACGGGGGDDDNTNGDNDGGDSANTSLDYSGETKQAAMTSDNVDELASAAASGSKQAVSSDSLSDSVPVVGQRSDSPVSQEQINEELAQLIGGVLSGGSQLAGRGTAARTEDLSAGLCDSGSVIVEFPDNGIAGNWSIEFNQCTRNASFGSSSYSSTFDGSVEGTYVQAGNGYQLSLNYTNFTVSITHPYGSYTDTFNMSMTCTASNQEGTDVSCEYYVDYQGYDERTYRVTEASVSGNSSSGYQVSVRVYDPEHGYVTVTTEVPVTFDCSDGHPSAGRIRVEAADGATAVVEFTSCSQYVVTFEGVAQTYTWP
jgi:hypothetical protein